MRLLSESRIGQVNMALTKPETVWRGCRLPIWTFFEDEDGPYERKSFTPVRFKGRLFEHSKDQYCFRRLFISYNDHCLELITKALPCKV